MWVFCSHVGFCACVAMNVFYCVYVCALPSDLWGLSSSASSLSLLAWRMNGPLSALPQPLLLLSLSLKLPFFFSVLPFLFASALSYLPTCSSSARTLSSSLPFALAYPLLCSLSWFDPFLPCLVTLPFHWSSPSVTANSSAMDLGCALTKSWPLISSLISRDTSFECGASISSIHLVCPCLHLWWLCCKLTELTAKWHVAHQWSRDTGAG